jgi:hypothetical protein
VLHDVGARDVSFADSASPGGLGHLANFMGTDMMGPDMMDALFAVRRLYG